jgi:hypothetical protein
MDVSFLKGAIDLWFGPKLNNRGGTASDESIQGEAVKTGCVDTIVNDVKFFPNKYENGESHRWN